MYAVDPVFDVLLQITDDRSHWPTPDVAADGHWLAMAFLATEASGDSPKITQRESGMNEANSQFVIDTYRRPYQSARGDAVVRVGSDPFAVFIAELAQRSTNSPEEAEAALKEMNADIQRCAERQAQPTSEGHLAAGIALRRLINFLQ